MAPVEPSGGFRAPAASRRWPGFTSALRVKFRQFRRTLLNICGAKAILKPTGYSGPTFCHFRGGAAVPTTDKSPTRIGRWDHPHWDIALTAIIVAGAAAGAVPVTLTGLLEWWESAAMTGSLALLMIGVLWTVESMKRQKTR
jgi:hypothetical protein